MINNSTLFELSWEVCNKVGGIYTVIESKSKYANLNFKNYYLIGPHLENSKNYFKEEKIPNKFKDSYKELLNLGIKIHFGTTQLNVETKVILVEYLGYSSNINSIKQYLWEKYQIDSLNSQWYDFDEAILWSWCSGIVIEKLSKSIENNILVHAHEWMSTGSIFYINSINSEKIKTIFTTHATMLGRSMSSNGLDVYKDKNKIDPNNKSYELNIHTKHQTERAAANNCNCFTTVSDITNEEAKIFYQKSANKLLYNGFDNSNLTLDNLNEKFQKSRNKTNEFIKKQFPSLDLDKTKLFYTSGRNEFKNKGYDIYIESLSELNIRLINENSPLTLVNFFLVMVGKFEPIKNNIYSPYNIYEHDIIESLKKHNLNNSKEDKIKNIIIPIILDGNDSIINREYYEFITGFDFGVFPSYYEPWGYTPLESIAYGVPAITSDLSGFGKTIEHTCSNSCSSVRLLNREDIEKDLVIFELSYILYKVLNETKKASIFQREVAKLLALKYDWSEFYDNYLQAYKYALTQNF